MTAIEIDDRDARLQGTFLARDALRELTVIVGGVGALGNEIVRLLLMLGVGRIIVVDPDHVEISNGTRSVLFSIAGLEEAAACARPKVEVVLEAAHRIRPEVEVVPWRGKIRELGHGIYAGADLVFSAFDHLLPRYQMSARAVQAGRPMVDGGIGGGDAGDMRRGQAMFFDSSEVCYACNLTGTQRLELAAQATGGDPGCTRAADMIWTQGSLPTTPMLASAVASAQVSLALQHLMEDAPRPPRPGSGVEIDFGGGGGPLARIPRHPACPHHGGLPPSIATALDRRGSTLTIGELFEAGCNLLGEPATLLLPESDVREAACDSCGRRMKGHFGPVSELSERACPRCEVQGMLRPTRMVGHIGPGDLLLDMTLEQAQLPVCDRFFFQAASGRRGALDVTGDLGRFFKETS